jgi:TorA maturation chaperone TorD
MVGDRELFTFRLGYYELFVSLLWKEPAGELLAALANGMPERVKGARQLHPLLGQGWEEIGQFLTGMSPDRYAETVGEEYTKLFIGSPAPEVQPYESYYLTGHLMDRPLALIRALLKTIGIERQAEYPEPEDCLAFELEVMRRLIARQGSAKDPDSEVRWLNGQAVFLKEHLLVWGPAFCRDLSGAEGAGFYKAAATLLQGFLEMEREQFRRWGPGEVRSLEDVRQSFAGTGEWRGPLFDPTVESGPTERVSEA